MLRTRRAHTRGACRSTRSLPGGQSARSLRGSTAMARALAVDRERHATSATGQLRSLVQTARRDHGGGDRAVAAHPRRGGRREGPDPTAARLPTSAASTAVGVGTDERPLRRLGPYRDRGRRRTGRSPPGRSARRRAARRTRSRRWRSRRAGGRPPPRRSRTAGPQTGKRTATSTSSGDDGGLPRAFEERRRPAPSARPRAGDLDLGVERERHGGILRRRVGVGDRAADACPGCGSGNGRSAASRRPAAGRRGRSRRSPPPRSGGPSPRP